MAMAMGWRCEHAAPLMVTPGSVGSAEGALVPGGPPARLITWQTAGCEELIGVGVR